MKTPMKQILEQALKDFEGALKTDKRKYHYTPNTIDNRVRGARAFVGYLLGEEWRKFIPGKGKRLQVPLFSDARVGGRVVNRDIAIGMRRAAASLMLGWLVFLGRSLHVFAIAKISGEGAGRPICGVMGTGRES